MYDTDGQLLREAWMASGQGHCPHADCASERSFGGVSTGYSICRTCGMRLSVLHSETLVNKKANDHLVGEQKGVAAEWNQRRASFRLTVAGTIVLERATFNEEGRLINVSIPGCGVESPMSVSVGDDLRLRLYLFDEEAAIYVPHAIVRWKNQMRFGLQFLVWEETDRQRLTQFIARGITVGV
jgi:hypothetical protein